MGVKGVIYKQEKPYLGLKSATVLGGGAVNGGAVLGGRSTVVTTQKATDINNIST